MKTEAPEKERQLPAWNLTDYYASLEDERIQKDLDAASALAKEFGDAYRGKVASLSPAEMVAALGKFEEILDRVYRPEIFAHLLYAANSGKSEHGKLLAQTQERAASIDEATLFFGLELLDISNERIEEILSAPEMAPYKHYIRRRRLLKDHKLSEKEERLLAKTNLTGHSAWTRMFHEIVDHQKYRLTEDGEPLNFARVASLLYSAKREQREAAAVAITRGLEPLQRQLVFLYNTVLLDQKVGDEIRNFKTPMDSRNIANETDLKSVQAMLDACDRAAPDICHRYYKLKRELLGVDQLMDYDRYAPLPDSERNIPYDEARELTLDAFAEFSPKFADIARQFFEKDWIDAPPRESKNAGAFCSGGVPSVHSYILLNYTGKMADVKTMAHELGHGVHFELSRGNSMLVMNPTLCLAETASVFAERVTLERLLRTTPDPNQKLSLLCNELEQSFATVFRQVGFTRFEWAAHNARRDEGELSPERLNEIWMETGRVMFGDSLTLGDHYKIWWSYIPHFIHTPFYCYAYAFGKLLVLALYQLYRERGEAFVPQYMDLLSAGGNASPNELLAPLGVDLRDPGFWDKGLTVLRDMVTEAEKLARQ